MNHSLQIKSTKFVEINPKSKTTTGKLKKVVDNETFDFNQMKFLHKHIIGENSLVPNGYDTIYVFDNTEGLKKTKAALKSSPDSGIIMVVKSDSECLKVNTGNFDGTIKRKKGDHISNSEVYEKFAGISFEAYSMPDILRL